MKIAITCPASLPATPFGGILMVAVNLAKKIAEKNHEITIYTTDLNFTEKKMNFDKKLPTEEMIDGFKIKRSHVFLKIYMYFINPNIFFQLKKDNPNVIHIIGIRSFQAFTAAIISKFNKIPLTVSDYGGLTTHPEIQKTKTIKKIFYKIQNPMLKFIMNQADVIIAANEYEKKDFLNICKTDKIQIIKNGIDLNKLQSNKLNFKNKYSCPEKIILFVGRFSLVKGIDILLKSFKELSENKKYSNIKLVILGSDFGYYTKMMKMIKEFNLKEKTIVVVNPSREDVISAYHACEFLVLPSRWELSPLTPLEGFACKKTVISSNISGIPFVISHNKTGLLVESENYKELTKVMEKLFDEPEFRKNLEKNAFIEVTEKLNSDKMTEGFLQVFENIVKKKGLNHY
jgi:glycosyltransferase involved in cell wall biosynthesis